MPTPAKTYLPKGSHTITPQLYFNGQCKEAIPFYEKVFGAKLLYPPMTTEDGRRILHAMLQIGDSQFMVSDGWPGSHERGPDAYSTCGLYIYVPDCDAIYQKAIDSGCEVIHEMMDAFWGDRGGRVKDPFGHCWGIATMRYEMTPEEVKQGQEKWLASIKK